LAIGAMPVHLSWIQIGPWTSPDEKGYGIGPDFSCYIAQPYGLFVDPTSGKRFVNELADRRIRGDAILATGRPCIAIADARGVEISGFRVDHCLRKGVVKQLESIEAVAHCYRIPADALKETVAAYNQAVAKGIDPQFGKPIIENAAPLTHPPFFCMRLWPKTHYTMGGIGIDAGARVFDLKGQCIPGFYAAGEVTGGVHGACRLGSCAITDCLVFGRIAGQNVAAESPI
jgi:succinate dehydrogenase/fumarate reductase flavoprotein subunit